MMNLGTNDVGRGVQSIARASQAKYERVLYVSPRPNILISPSPAMRFGNRIPKSRPIAGMKCSLPHRSKAGFRYRFWGLASFLKGLLLIVAAEQRQSLAMPVLSQTVSCGASQGSHKPRKNASFLLCEV
jgi:hypothetical protein